MNFLNAVVAYVKAHWVTIIALAAVIWAYAKPTVIAFVAAHPKTSFWYGLIGVIVSFYMKSGSLKNLVTLGYKP